MASTPRIVSCRIGPYELDLRSGDLTRNGRLVRLQEKPRSILIALAERPGEIVTRAELRERLWAEDTFVDFEDGLNTAMRKLREVLGDDPQSPRYIETARGRGYRLIAKVDALPPSTLTSVVSSPPPTEIAGAAPSVPAEVDPAPESVGQMPSRPSMRRWRNVAAAIFFGCAMLALLIFVATRWRAAHPQTISIAVLPLANMTGDPSRSYLSNGVTEELIARLGQLWPDRLRVIAPTSAMSYAGSNKTTQQIGRELGVNYVIEGSLQQQGANIRVVAKLVRARDQTGLWANTYDGDVSNLLEFENSVADSVVRALAVKLPSLPPAGYRPAKYEAHDDYLQGLYFVSQRSKSGFEQAMESFAKAVAADPKYAEAYARLAVTYNLMGQYNWMSPANAQSQGRAAAEQALALDPGQAEAHAALGFSLWYYQWDRIAAESEFRKAIVLAPQNVDAHHWFAQLLMTDKRFAEAEDQMRAALELDPESAILRINLGWLHYFERRFPQAIAEMRAVATENPSFLTAHYKLWYAYSVAGDDAQAWEEFQKVVHSITGSAHEQLILQAYQRGGYAEALKALLGGDSEYNGSLVDGARCLAFADDRAGALLLLDRAYHAHEGWMIFAAADPAFDKLRSDAKFERLLTSVGRGQ
jgi:TolB-like protein/DNA-binding winged helix-turn-helix (wHTH) protein/Flp pilus assembly protein TadD